MNSVLVVLLAVSPYISRVLEYQPAPGQFCNTTICTPENLIGAESSMLYLGAYGGYVTFGFDHKVMNVADRKDLLIRGNAFANNCEPGVIQVSRDDNGNGLPDDTWYEIAGAAEDSAETIFGYEITYFKPDSLNQNILWRDNRGDSGYIYRNTYHTQAYWQEDMDRETLTFRGTRLPDNAYVADTSNAQLWLLPGYAFGYADNRTDSIDLDWAVDIETRLPVRLDGVDFVRVYTGVNQTCGWIGETSTEILGAEDLNVPTGVETVQVSANPQSPDVEPQIHQPTAVRIISGHVLMEVEGHLYDLLGHPLPTDF